MSRKYDEVVTVTKTEKRQFKCKDCGEVKDTAYSCSCTESCDWENKDTHDYKEFLEISSYYDNLPNAICFMVYKKCIKCNRICWVDTKHGKKKSIEMYYSNYKDDPLRTKMIEFLRKEGERDND